MPIRPRQTVAVAGAAAISASLIGWVTSPQATQAPTQHRAVALTAGDAEIFAPDLASFTPSTAEGFPPVIEVFQGAELWQLLSPSGGVNITLDGDDTQTTIGSFVNDDFLEHGGIEGGAGEGESLPYQGSEIDLSNYGGGFENEWSNLIDSTGGHTITDTIITPFGDYTIPLGSTTAAAAQVVDGYSFADLIKSVENTLAFGDNQITEAATAFAAGHYPLALSEELAGFNNLTLGVANDLLTNGYAALTGADGNAGFELANPGQPIGFAIGVTEAQEFLSQAQNDFSMALAEFANGNVYFGLADLSGIGVDSTNATDAIILSLFDSLPGMTFIL